METTVDDKRLFWVDLETTGLDANADIPLECAIGLTDEWGNNLVSKTSLIYEMNTKYGVRVAQGKSHEFVGPMHEKSGLWADLDYYYGHGVPRLPTQSVMPRLAQDTLMVGWLRDNGVKEGTLPMCGNSIGSLDRPFFLQHFPLTNAFLSYRNIDVSSFKETCRRVNPELFDRLRPVAETKDAAAHRALDDLKASIAEYQAYLDNFFFTSLGD